MFVCCLNFDPSLCIEIVSIFVLHFQASSALFQFSKTWCRNIKLKLAETNLLKTPNQPPMNISRGGNFSGTSFRLNEDTQHRYKAWIPGDEEFWLIFRWQETKDSLRYLDYLIFQFFQSQKNRLDLTTDWYCSFFSRWFLSNHLYFIFSVYIGVLLISS